MRLPKTMPGEVRSCGMDAAGGNFCLSPFNLVIFVFVL